jgi:hypothetical protein
MLVLLTQIHLETLTQSLTPWSPMYRQWMLQDLPTLIAAASGSKI